MDIPEVGLSASRSRWHHPAKELRQLLLLPAAGKVAEKQELDKSLESYDSETTNIFIEKHIKYLKNLLFFCGVINFNETELKVITKKVFSLLETILKYNKYKYLINNKYFNLFFLRQRKKIEIIDLKKFLAISLSNKQIFSSELTYIIADFLQIKKVSN